MIRSLRLPQAVSRLILASLIALLTWSVSSADTHYVSHSGSDIFPYTSWITATDSLRAAIEAADTYDTILVAAGNYTSDSLLLKKGQVFMGAGMDSTHVLHNGNFFGLLVVADSSVTRGFHFDASVDTLFGGDLDYHLGNAVGGYEDVNAVFTNNRITNSRCAFILLSNSQNNPDYRVHIDSCEISHFRQAILAIGTSTKVTNNSFRIQDSDIGSTFRQIGGDAEIRGNRFIKTVKFCGSGVIDLNPVYNVVVNNNLFVLDPTSLGPAIVLNRLDPGLVAEGEIVNNTFIGGVLGIQFGSANTRVYNNILAFVVDVDIGPRFPGDTLVSYNEFWQNNFNFPFPTDTADFEARFNIFADPMFVDPLDYMLQVSSPAIDAGHPSILDTDGSRSDMGYCGGPGGLNAACPDLPPSAPSKLVARNVTNGIQIEWSKSIETDFAEYWLWRSTAPIVEPYAGLVFASVAADTAYLDTSASHGTVYYFRVSAVDAQGNRSAMSPEVVVASADIGDNPQLPDRVTLSPNFPNPFNASTQIKYALPKPAPVRLMIYDVMGRHVSTVVSATQSAGEYSTSWNGTDDHGHAVGSGVYFYRLTVSDEVTARKMLLLK